MASAFAPAFIGSYRQTFTSGAVTTVAAGSSTAGHILALRSGTSGKAVRLRSLEIEFLLTTAFSAAQEVGFDVFVARSYTAAHTGATALTIANNDGKEIADEIAAVMTGRIADTGALTAGTHTLDDNPIARGGVWCGAVGATLGPRFYDFTACHGGGILLQNNEGIVIRNTILMGTAGVGKWHFTPEWDQFSVG